MGVTAAIKIKKHLILDIAWVQQQQQKRKHPIIRTSKTIYSQVILAFFVYLCFLPLGSSFFRKKYLSLWEYALKFLQLYFYNYYRIIYIQISYNKYDWFT